MKIDLLAFGIANDIIGKRFSQLELEHNVKTVGDLRQMLYERYPGLSNLKTLAIAINEAYADDDKEISVGDTVALIPPVSGG